MSKAFGHLLNATPKGMEGDLSKSNRVLVAEKSIRCGDSGWEGQVPIPAP